MGRRLRHHRLRDRHPHRPASPSPLRTVIESLIPARINWRCEDQLCASVTGAQETPTSSSSRLLIRADLVTEGDCRGRVVASRIARFGGFSHSADLTKETPMTTTPRPTGERADILDLLRTRRAF